MKNVRESGLLSEEQHTLINFKLDNKPHENFLNFSATSMFCEINKTSGG